MADPNLSSGDRLRAFQLLFLLNRSFHRIVGRLSDLDSLGVFNPQKISELRGLTQELQTEINHNLIGPLYTVENKDWHTFGEVRVARDNRFHQPIRRSSKKR